MTRTRVVVVGAGFAGFQAARTLSRTLRGTADVVVLNPTDYFLYVPLLPQVAAGILEPRRVTVSLPAALPHVRLALGEADRVDLDRRRVHYTDPEGIPGELSYDRLVLAVGSVNKLLPIPGVAEHAHGFRSLPEALYLRDHVVRQMELSVGAVADWSPGAPSWSWGRATPGVEVAAQGVLFTNALARRLDAPHRVPAGSMDIADRVLPQLDRRLSTASDRVLRRRGVEVRTWAFRQGGHRGQSPPGRRRVRRHPDGRLVRGRATRPARRRGRTARRGRPARRRPHADGPRPPRGLRLRRRRGRAGPDSPGGAHPDDGAGRDAPGPARRAQRGGLARPRGATPVPMRRLRGGAVCTRRFPLRIRLREALWETPQSARELADRADLPADRLSYHLGRLERAGLVEIAEYRPLPIWLLRTVLRA